MSPCPPTDLYAHVYNYDSDHNNNTFMYVHAISCTEFYREYRHV